MPLVVAIGQAAGPVTPVEPGQAVVRLSYTPAEAGATVTQVRLYTDPARTGTPAYTGTPANAGGVWAFTAPLADGDYYSAFDVTDTTGQYTDGGDFFYVLDGEVVPGSTVVSMAALRQYLFNGTTDRADDRELLDDLTTAVDKVADMVDGPLVPTVRTETFPATGTVILPATATAVTSVSRGGVVADAGSYSLRNGLLANAYASYGDLSVTYVAGFSPLPSRVRRAVLRYVKWQWSRDHGGSETYMPGGDDAVPGLGPDGIERELRSILGDLARGMRVA